MLVYGTESESGLQIEQRTAKCIACRREGIEGSSVQGRVGCVRVLGVPERAVLDVVSDWPLMDGEQIRRMTGYSKWSVTMKLLSANLSRIGLH